MCGIAGIIYRDGVSHDIGVDMTAMLQSMKHRGPDSTGYALYNSSGNGNGELILRYKLADANEPRDFDFVERLARKRREVEARLGDVGADVEELDAETDYAFRARLRYRGNPKTLTDYIES